MHEQRLRPADELALLVAPLDRWIFYPAAHALFRVIRTVPVTPNQISALHLVLGLSTFWWLAKPSGPSAGIAVGLFMVRNVLDCLDGVVARARNLTTPMGRILDEWSDALSAVALVAGAGVAASRQTDMPWMPVAVTVTIVAVAILALQNELCRRRIASAIDTGTDCVWPDYVDARQRRSAGVGAWLGHLADWSKLHLSGAVRDPMRLAAEARFIKVQTGTTAQRRLLQLLSFAAGDNAILLLLAFVLAQQYVAGLVATVAYSLVLSRATFLLMTRYLSQAPDA